MTLADLGSPIKVIMFYCSQNFKLSGFPIFRFWSYLVKVISETRDAHYIWYLRFNYIRSLVSDM
jgi:hypothetical protein